jgi:hypothetical protein
MGAKMKMDRRSAMSSSRRNSAWRVIGLCALVTIGLTGCSAQGSDEQSVEDTPTTSATTVADSSCSTNNPVASTTDPLEYTGTVQTVTVPDGVCAVVMLNVIGGGGGSAEASNNPAAAGALVDKVVVPVSPGDKILTFIGGAGETFQSQGVAGCGGLGGLGGNGGPGGVNKLGGAGGGGGATTVQVQHGTQAPQTIVVAGGAGGGSTGLASGNPKVVVPSYPILDEAQQDRESGQSADNNTIGEGVPGGNAGTNGPTTSGGFMIWQGNRGQSAKDGGGGGGLAGVSTDPAYGGIGGNGSADDAGSGGGGGGGYQGGYGGNGTGKAQCGGGGGGAGSTAVATQAWVADYSTVGPASAAYGGKNGTAQFQFISIS